MTTASRYRVAPDGAFRLDEHDPAATELFDRDSAERDGLLVKLSERLNDLEDVLCASHKHSVLVVLQGMDGAGKDEIVCNVFQRVNPSRLRVAQFGEPSENDRDHDYLWRVHRQAPARGEIAIFDRSHYEGVLVERVHDIVPESIWRKRYEQIDKFEEALADHGTVILKFFLHLSKDAQKRRLEERLADPKKAWKFAESDVRERKLWARYMEAYEEAIARTSTDYAPWFVVPSDERWYRDLVVASIVVEAIDGLRLRYPDPKVDPASVRID